VFIILLLNNIKIILCLFCYIHIKRIVGFDNMCILYKNTFLTSESFKFSEFLLGAGNGDEFSLGYHGFFHAAAW